MGWPHPSLDGEVAESVESQKLIVESRKIPSINHQLKTINFFSATSANQIGILTSGLTSLPPSRSKMISGIGSL
jgi:hypothetical protein